MKAYDRGSPVTFVMLFVVGFFMASMTRQLKSQTRESAKKAYRTEILLENSRKLRRCKSKEEVWKQVATQVVKLLNLSIIIYPVNESGGLEEPLLFPRKDMEIINLKQFVNAKEKAVVQWLSLIDTGQVLAHIPCQMRMQCIYLSIHRRSKRCDGNFIGRETAGK